MIAIYLLLAVVGFFVVLVIPMGFIPFLFFVFILCAIIGALVEAAKQKNNSSHDN